MASSGSFGVHITPETTTWGTIPGSPTWVFLPVEPTSGIDVVETLSDDARRGLAAIGFRQLEGVHRTELTLAGPVYPDELGPLVRSLIGSDTFQAGTPATHNFDVETMTTAAGNSFQVQILDAALGGAESYTHEGCVATQMTFRFNASEGLFTHETTVLGKGMVTDTAQSAITDATEEPFRGWHADVTTSTGLGAGSSGRLIEAEISIARDADLLYVAQDDKFPKMLYPGLVAVTGRFTASYDLLANLELYRNLTQEDLIIECEYGAGAAQRSFDFEFPAASFGDSPAEIDRSGNNMTIAYNFRGLIGTTTTGAPWATDTDTNVRLRMRNTSAVYTVGS